MRTVKATTQNSPSLTSYLHDLHHLQYLKPRITVAPSKSDASLNSRLAINISSRLLCQILRTRTLRKDKREIYHFTSYHDSRLGLESPQNYVNLYCCAINVLKRAFWPPNHDLSHLPIPIYYMRLIYRVTLRENQIRVVTLDVNVEYDGGDEFSSRSSLFSSLSLLLYLHSTCLY